MSEATNRFTQAITEVVNNESDKHVIGIVAHGNVLALFASQYEDRDALAIHSSIRMPDIAIFDWEQKTFDILFGNYESNN